MSNMKGRATAGFAGVTAIVLCISFATPALATDDPTAGAIRTIAPEMLVGLAPLSPASAGDAKTGLKTKDGAITIANRAAEGLTLTGSGDSKLMITIPQASEVHGLGVTTNGLAVFDHGDDYSTVVAPKLDGSLQLGTVLASVAAPTRYSYKVDAGKGGHLEVRGDLVIAYDGLGAFAGAVAPPWAKDAAGKAVPTHYEVSGNVLTQVVDHVGSNFTYPIVADPWIGINLFDFVHRTNYSTYYKISALLSPWGRTIHTSAYIGATSGMWIMQIAGWDEIKSRQPSANTTTIYQQYQCHALGGIFEWDTWDFESNRSNNSNYFTWVGTLCNW